MPTFKHPCPYCGQVEPFSPKRCQNCRKIVEDPAWVVCPTCGASLTMPVAAVAGSGAGKAGAASTPATPPAAAAQASAPAQPERQPLPVAAPAPAGKCSGCGAPLPAGARFCTICGTMAG